jgi:hypothetical protein
VISRASSWRLNWCAFSLGLISMKKISFNKFSGLFRNRVWMRYISYKNLQFSATTQFYRLPQSNLDSGRRSLGLADQKCRLRELQICCGFGCVWGQSSPEVGWGYLSIVKHRLVGFSVIDSYLDPEILVHSKNSTRMADICRNARRSRGAAWAP